MARAYEEEPFFPDMATRNGGVLPPGSVAQQGYIFICVLGGLDEESRRVMQPA